MSNICFKSRLEVSCCVASLLKQSEDHAFFILLQVVVGWTSFFNKRLFFVIVSRIYCDASQVVYSSFLPL